MGFVEVKKDQKTIRVSESAYREQFKKAGWIRVQKKRASTRAANEWDEIAEEEVDDLSEKPISELTPDEVKRLAEEKGIKIDGKNTRQLRDELKKRL